MSQAPSFETDFWKDANLRKVWDEIIPGEWHLELYYRGRKLMEQTFVMRYEGV